MERRDSGMASERRALIEFRYITFMNFPGKTYRSTWQIKLSFLIVRTDKVIKDSAFGIHSGVSLGFYTMRALAGIPNFTN